MNQNNQVKRLLMMGIPMMILFLVCAVFQSQLAGKEEVISRTVSEAFGVSLSSGFYNESQTITVTVPKGATVYYTDDCSVPNRENGKVYSDAIDIAALDEEIVYTYRFKAYYEDGSESKVINRTYFCGVGIDTRYTTNVLHIAGDPDGLFGYENGIFVNGEDFDEY
ncbi:MAG: chitobiase/beta-hexosaminidase C-terminal domain-containing protein, partial [Eubacterium sp.]|nr:chitobiase/beta-hexosaminidase C-terminal domain-containing protein [Eubacterium sp.]